MEQPEEEQISAFEAGVNADAQPLLDRLNATTKPSTVKIVAKSLDDYVRENVEDQENGATPEEIEDLQRVALGKQPNNGFTFDTVAELVKTLGERGAYDEEEPVEEEPVEEEPVEEERPRSKQPKTARKSASPQRKSASPPRKSASPPRKKAIVKKPTGKVYIAGLENVMPFARGKLAKLEVDPRVFWDGTKVGANFDEDQYPKNERALQRSKFVKAEKYNRFRKPYPGKILNRIQELNFAVIKKLSAAIATTASGFGRYGDKATFQFNVDVASKDRKSLVRHAYTVDKDTFDRARLILLNRIDTGLLLEKERSKREPSERPALKESRTVLTPAAVDWIADETFVTQYYKGGEDFKKWLAKKLGKRFTDTYVAKGYITRGNYQRIVHLALEKTKDYSIPSNTVFLEGRIKPVVVFDYTDALTALNSTRSEFTYVRQGKNVVKTIAGKKDTATVAEAIINGGKDYAEDVLYQPSVMILTAMTSYSKDTADPHVLAFIDGTNVDEDFIKETEAINEYFKALKPAVSEASTQRTKLVAKQKKAAAAKKKQLATMRKGRNTRVGRK